MTRYKVYNNSKKVWTLADSEEKGFLTQSSFYKALKLIAIAQMGNPVTLSSLQSSKTI